MGTARSITGLTGMVLAIALLLSGCDANQPGPPRASAQVSRDPGTPTPSPARTESSSSAPTACVVPVRLRHQDVERLPVARPVVALTFDAGANAAGAPSILRTLATRHVPATFFLTGSFARSYSGWAARIAREHLVGNHTDTHPDLTTLSDEAVIAEVRRAERAIRSITGEDPRRFFRFPFGARTGHDIEILNRLCYVPFRWTVDTLGWEGTSGGQSVGSVVKRVMAAAQNGEVVLMHVGAHPQDGSTLDASALPTVITRLRRAGFRLVSLNNVMSAAP